MPEKYVFETPAIKERQQILREFLDYERRIVLDSIKDLVPDRTDIYTTFECRLKVPESYIQMKLRKIIDFSFKFPDVQNSFRYTYPTTDVRGAMIHGKEKW